MKKEMCNNNKTYSFGPNIIHSLTNKRSISSILHQIKMILGLENQELRLLYISFINEPELDHFMVNLENRKNLVRITRDSIQTSRQYSNSIRTNGILNQLIFNQFKPLPPLVLPPIHPHFPPSSGPPPPSPKSLSIYN